MPSYGAQGRVGIVNVKPQHPSVLLTCHIHPYPMFFIFQTRYAGW